MQKKHFNPTYTKGKLDFTAHLFLENEESFWVKMFSPIKSSPKFGKMERNNLTFIFVKLLKNTVKVFIFSKA